MKIIVGNTGMGYYKELVHYDNYIDLRYIPELSTVRKDSTGIEIGAAVMISKAIEALKRKKMKVDSVKKLNWYSKKSVTTWTRLLPSSSGIQVV